MMVYSCVVSIEGLSLLIEITVLVLSILKKLFSMTSTAICSCAINSCACMVLMLRLTLSLHERISLLICALDSPCTDVFIYIKIVMLSHRI